MPFLSNCKGYDSYMSISKLFEEHPDCTRVSYENTKNVNRYRWNLLLNPLSDQCEEDIRIEDREVMDDGTLSTVSTKGIDLECTYEEQVEIPGGKPRWFEAEPNTKIFYITKEPRKSDEVFTATYDMNNEIEERWGRRASISEMIDTNDFKLVPVIVDEADSGFSNSIPKLVLFQLLYYQEVSERSGGGLMKTRIRATTELTLFIIPRMARSSRSSFIKNAPRFARRS